MGDTICTPAAVWHYTVLDRLQPILQSGALQPSNAGAPDEAPLLWFSRRQDHEPTAVKLLGGPRPRLMTFAEQRDLFGWARFGLPSDDPRLLDWTAACRAAGTRRNIRRSMERLGIRLGASPDDWFAAVGSVEVIDCIDVQRLADGAWVSVFEPEVA